MTFAKGIANGMPVGATIATDDVANSMTGLSISTFGGNPISMAATDATLSVMEDNDIPARAERLGGRLREALEAFAKDFDFIGDVRGMGLMQGVELVEDRTTKEPAPGKTSAVMEAAKREGLLLGKGGRWGNVIRIAPPMLISETQLDEGIAKLERAFASVK